MATPTTEIYTLSLHDALPIYDRDRRADRAPRHRPVPDADVALRPCAGRAPRRHLTAALRAHRSEEHTSELQSRRDLVCRLLLEKKKQVVLDIRTVDNMRFRSV